MRRCLEKDPNQRLRDLGDAAIEINETRSRSAHAPPMTLPAEPRKMVMIIVAALIIVLSGLITWFLATKQTQPTPRPIRLVVLPFENLGPPEDDYFAAGITDCYGHMSIFRQRSIRKQSLPQNLLARCVVEMFLAANDVCNVH